MTPSTADAVQLRTAVLALPGYILHGGDLKAINETVVFPDRFNDDENLAAVVALDVVNGDLVITLKVAGQLVRV
jgi:hypothetical protein